MKNLFKISIFSLLLAVSCQTESEKFQSELVEMEKQLEEDVSLDTALANSITSSYIRYVNLYPTDTLAPEYLIRAADIMKELPLLRLKSINVYYRVFTDYPKHELAPKAIFMMGFVFDEKYHDKIRANKSYNFFLETFPDHKLAAEVKNLQAVLNNKKNELEQVRVWLDEAKQKKNKK